MTPKQIALLSNLAEGPNLSHTFVKGVVAPFTRRNAHFGPAHVVGSMLQRLSQDGYCYGVLTKTKNGTKSNVWHITELGFNTMLNEVAGGNNAHISSR